MPTRRFLRGLCLRPRRLKTVTSSLKMCQSKSSNNTWVKKYILPTKLRKKASSSYPKSSQDRARESGLKKPWIECRFWSQSRFRAESLRPSSTSRWARAKRGADYKIGKTWLWRRKTAPAPVRSVRSKRRYWSRAVTPAVPSLERVWSASEDYRKTRGWNECVWVSSKPTELLNN